jgi:serine protease Do
VSRQDGGDRAGREAVRTVAASGYIPGEAPWQAQAPPAAAQGWIGVRVQPVTEVIGEAVGLSPARGVIVSGTREGPARAAGIVPGDVILRFDGHDIVAAHDLSQYVTRTAPGQTVEMVLWRHGAEVRLNVAVGRIDAAPAAVPAPARAAEVHLFGLTLEPLSAELRQRFHLADQTGPGAAVTAVEANSQAAKNKIAPGEVVVGVGDVAIATPAEAAAQVDARRREGRQVVLLLLRNLRGEPRFVPLTIEADTVEDGDAP